MQNGKGTPIKTLAVFVRGEEWISPSYRKISKFGVLYIDSAGNGCANKDDSLTMHINDHTCNETITSIDWEPRPQLSIHQRCRYPECVFIGSENKETVCNVIQAYYPLARFLKDNKWTHPFRNGYLAPSAAVVNRVILLSVPIDGLIIW